MPFKANAARRHHIPKQRHRVTSWAEYDAALRQTEGLIGSILRLLGLELTVPDHSTLSCRAGTLEVRRPWLAGRPARRCTCW